MARRDRLSLRAVAEARAGECRALASAMRTHAEQLTRRRERAERSVVEAWEAWLLSIADALTDAAADYESSSLRTFLRATARTLEIVAAAVTLGGLGALHFEDAPDIVHCVEALRSGAAETDGLLNEDEREAKIAARGSVSESTSDTASVSANVTPETVRTSVNVPSPTVGTAARAVDVPKVDSTAELRSPSVARARERVGVADDLAPPATGSSPPSVAGLGEPNMGPASVTGTVAATDGRDTVSGTGLVTPPKDQSDADSK